MVRSSPFQPGELVFAALVCVLVSAGIFSSSLFEQNAMGETRVQVPAESSWDESIEYYSFSAETLRTAHANMFAASPIVIDGRKFSGVMEWEWEWRAAYETSGGMCAPDRVVTRASSKITLPKWEGYHEASYSERKEWDRAQKVLMRHEKKHETIAKMAVREFERKANALPAEASCQALTDTINVLFDRYMKQANHQNKSYDRRTDHGATEGAALRLPNFSSGY